MTKSMRLVQGLLVLFLSGAVWAGDLGNEFASPPDSARMWTWWFWLGDKVDKESLTADLEAFKEQGIGGVTVYSLSGPGVPGKGPDYMSAEWRDLWKHTLKEAERLGLGVSTLLCSGWNAGGPWITPEQACKKHVSSELVLKGPQQFKGELPHPAADERFYRDVAIQAFPLAEATNQVTITLTASSSHPSYPVGQAGDGDGASFWVSNGEKPNEGPSQEKPEWLKIDLGEQRVVKKVGVQQRPGYGPKDAELQTSEDGTNFEAVVALVMDRDTAAEITLPDKPVRYLRLFITSTYSPQSENVQVCEVLLDGQPLKQGGLSPLMALKALSSAVAGNAPTWEINGAVLQPLPQEAPGTAIAPTSVVDLTARCTADGVLEWDVPEGTWKILRTGFTLTGAMTSWSSPTGVGLESDPLDAVAMNFQFANTAALLAEDAGALTGKVFRSVQIDSWEISHPNWTAGFADYFRNCRGYDPLPYLPALSGQVMGSADVSDRFLYDYRKTVGDLVADNYFGRLSALAESKGLVQQSEAGGVCFPKAMALDCLKNLGRCAIPMGEFWQDGAWMEANQNKNGKQTASAAHLYGKKIAAAEAFTSGFHWLDSPATLKPTADRAFCEGFNHFFIFSSATRSEDSLPGTEFSAGTHFNRKITWWSQARGFNDYIARCSHLLQQGLFVADVLYYNGDQCPNFVGPKQVDPSLGPGYDYDVCNSEIILTRLACRDGRIVLPDGMSYRLLVLPERTNMPVEVLSKLKDLVAAGMTLIGPKPETAPGLRDYPQCDGQVKALADELWGDCDGKTITERSYGMGRVVWGKSVREVLGAAGVKPDFTVADAQPGAFLDWIHRSTEGAEIYFIANRLNRNETATCTFRVSGKQPELWDPVTGKRRDAAALRQDDDGMDVALDLPAYGSVFVIFRQQLAEGGGQRAEIRDQKQLMELAGSWTVQFDPKLGGPTNPVVFDTLGDWTAHSDPGIKYYSGTATYRKTFDFPTSDLRPPIFLSLGEVKNVARVRLNGNDLGTVWCAPWQVEITSAVKPGNNDLEIEVVNLWPNRLIGDGKLPVETRLTQTNIDGYYKGEHTLLPSGLLGPVCVMEVAQTPDVAQTVLFSDTFSVTANSADVNYQNTNGRQSGGMLGILNYIGAGNAYYSQVGHPYCPGALLLVGRNTDEYVFESPDHNFAEDPGTGAVSFVRLKVDPVLPDSDCKNPDAWVGVKLGTSSASRNMHINTGDGIGFAFRGNGNFAVFDGTTGLGEWPYTTDTNGFHAIEFRISGPVDGNPWDGMNGTAIAVFDHGKSSPFFCYRKPGVGYTNNWITLEGASGVSDGEFACHGVDDLQIGTGASVVATNLSLKVDFQHTTTATAPEKQVDFFDFNPNDAGSATYPTAAGSVTVALSGLDPLLGGFYNRGGVVNGGGLTFAGLYNDFAFKNGASPQSLTLILSGPAILPRERYTLTFYSYDDEATAGNHSVIFSGMSGTIGSAGPLTWTGGVDPTSNTAYAVSGVFKASASGTLTVSITDDFVGGPNTGVRLNALEIKAEPLLPKGILIGVL